jgi:anti-sigma regulatory factor (Ser/Thr protein kinase)
MNDSEERVFRAHRDDLQGALAFVEAFCERRGVHGKATLRLTLIVEELFTNIIVHGHGGDSDSAVHIGLQFGPALIGLHLEDSAPPFDPLRYLADAAPQLDRPAAERRVGGLGLPLVAHMSEGFTYLRVGGRNRSSLRVRLDG